MTPNDRPAARHAVRDRGAVLALVLVLVVVMGAIVLGLATYATTALTSSAITTDRTDARNAASAVVTWQIEELTHKRAAPCTTNSEVTVPTGLVAGAVATLRCVPDADVDGHPTALLVASATMPSGLSVAVSALVQVPESAYVVNVLRWTAT